MYMYEYMHSIRTLSARFLLGEKYKQLGADL